MSAREWDFSMALLSDAGSIVDSQDFKNVHASVKLWLYNINAASDVYAFAKSPAKLDSSNSFAY
jgi:hypothetical protein